MKRDTKAATGAEAAMAPSITFGYRTRIHAANCAVHRDITHETLNDAGL
jgi:hypothetical protein